MMEKPVRTQGEDAMTRSWSKIALAEAEALAGEIYGLAARARPLPSERDDTFRLTDADGREFTFKIANPAEEPAALAFQDGALLHLERYAAHVPVPRLVPTRQGARSFTLQTAEGGRILRLLTFLQGDLQYRTPHSAAQSRNVGRALAELGIGLQDYQGRPPVGKLMWDISHVLDLRAFVGFVGEERRPRAEAVLREVEAAAPRIAALERRQIIHNDFNPHNILMDPAAPERVTGIIDFGDMVHAPLVNDLAVALSYHLASDDWDERAGAFIQGFIAARPLSPPELELLPVLTRARLAMSIIIAEWRSAQFPENRDYILRNHASAWRGLQTISDLSADGLNRLVHKTSGA